MITLALKWLLGLVFLMNMASIISPYYTPTRAISLIIGERAKRARHSQVCSIENRMVRAKFCSYNP